MDQEMQMWWRAATTKVWAALIFTLVSLAVTVQSQSADKSTDPTEKAALLAFKRALIDNGNYLENWIETTDPCNTSTQWNGVFCAEADQPSVGTNFLHVTELRMLNWELEGTLVPDLGNLSALITLDVMWNSLTGNIPPTLGNLASLKILALNGNRLTGSIPPELGNLANMNRLQLDENLLDGPVPNTFGKLGKLQHLHLNNNSLTGPIPPELGSIPNIIHILLDSNQMSGPLPVQIANATSLVILQLDNNQFSGGIPVAYTTNLTLLTKLSCRNCSLSGPIPDLENLSLLYFLDLSYNFLNGSIPSIEMTNITTIILSHNQLEGTIPLSLPGDGTLQTLALGNNKLEGTIPDFSIPMDYTLNQQILDFQNNSFDLISLGLVAAAAHEEGNLTLLLSGNQDICGGSVYILELKPMCAPVVGDQVLQRQGNMNDLPKGGPIVVTYRLKSPGFSLFTSRIQLQFRQYIANGIKVDPSQISVQSSEWQPGPRLLILLIISPPANSQFNASEVERIAKAFANWQVQNSTFFGPYELLGFVLLGKDKSTLGKGAIAGIVVGVAAVVIFLLFGLGLLIHRRRRKLTSSQKRAAQMLSLKVAQQSMLKISGVTAFSYKELVRATNDFNESNEVGRGGYGKVYRGVLESGQVVAIKRANIEAIQRNTEFYNEIELLSRCHHRNLVALVGYCNDADEQMLVYEFMEGGTLHDNLAAAATTKLDFPTRIRIALGSARGILYLHTEANPPIFHRDIKSNNILLDEKRQAKVADFGLSRLAPEVDEASGETSASHVSTVVKGTPGYLDPEYFLTRKLTDKSDVYSLGVVFLELITGMQPISYGKNIVREVQALYESGNFLTVVDQRMGSYPSESIMDFARLAMSCVNGDTDARPTMHQVTRSLEEIAAALRAIGSLDMSKDDYSVSMARGHSVGRGFESKHRLEALGGASDSSSSSQPESTSNNTSIQGNDYVAPR